MKWWAVSGLIIAGLAASFFYFRWSSRIQQPLNFSHPLHVKARIPCSECHTNLETLPDSVSCHRCHSNHTLLADVQWIPVYRVAPDIIFDHKKHKDVSCAICHEQITSGAAWIHEYRFPMNFCMRCHAEKKAPNECHTCHLNR